MKKGQNQKSWISFMKSPLRSLFHTKSFYRIRGTCAVLLECPRWPSMTKRILLNRFLFAPKQYSPQIMSSSSRKILGEKFNQWNIHVENRRHTMSLTCKSIKHIIIDGTPLDWQPVKNAIHSDRALTAKPTNSAECLRRTQRTLCGIRYIFFQRKRSNEKIKRTICVVNCVSAANSSLSTICLHMFECVFASWLSCFASLIFHSVFGLILMCRIDVMLSCSIIFIYVYSRLERNSVTECVHGLATNYVYIFILVLLLQCPQRDKATQTHTRFTIRHIRQIAMNMLWKKIILKINLLFRYSAYFPTGLTHTVTQAQSNWLQKSTSCQTLLLAHLCRYNLYHSRFSLSGFFFLSFTRSSSSSLTTLSFIYINEPHCWCRIIIMVHLNMIRHTIKSYSTTSEIKHHENRRMQQICLRTKTQRK